jgi:predicted flap endonuclease-1-like 5' DNA nuclease
MGANDEYIWKLEAIGIRTTSQMLVAGKTPSERKQLAQAAGIPDNAVEELVKLSDLARIPGVKGVRARLYYESGVDTLDKLAAWEPMALREMLVDYVKRTGFEGIATLPKEAEYTVAQAKTLPRIVEY